jgi:hypothetical protein
MSNNSWRQYGGIRKHESFQNLSIGTLVADKVLLREKVSEVVNFVNNVLLTGVNLTITSPGVLYANKGEFAGTLIVKDNLTIGDKIYFGGSNNYSYFSRSGDYLGLNSSNPTATFEIAPLSTSTQNVFTVRSLTTTNRNIIAQNSNTKGITVTANDTNSYIDFFSRSSGRYFLTIALMISLCPS